MCPKIFSLPPSFYFSEMVMLIALVPVWRLDHRHISTTNPRSNSTSTSSNPLMMKMKMIQDHLVSTTSQRKFSESSTEP